MEGGAVVVETGRVHLGILGAFQDCLAGYYYPLGVKAVMDGLATMGFVRLFGWGAMLAALPVLVPAPPCCRYRNQRPRLPSPSGTPFGRVRPNGPR